MKEGTNNFDFNDLKTDSSSPSLTYILSVAEYLYAKLYNENKNLIDSYNFLEGKIEEIQYRINPSYKLTKIKNRDAKGSIVARVKWKFMVHGEYKTPPYIFVYVCSLEDYPLGIEDPKVQELAKYKIDDYFANKLPLVMEDFSGNKYEI